MKTIRTQIMLRMTVTILAMLLVLGCVTVYINYASTISTLQQSLVETAKIAADRVSNELKMYKDVAREGGLVAALSDPTVPVPIKEVVIKGITEYYGFDDGDLFGADGVGLVNAADCSDREWFKAAMRGELYMTDPLTNRVTGKTSVMFAAPLRQNGEPEGAIVGVVMFSPGEAFLSEIVGDIRVGENGGAWMLDKDGYTIADTDYENVVNHENTIEEAKTDKSLKAMAEMEQHMLKGETGTAVYTYGGEQEITAYAPVEGTNGWSIGVAAVSADFMRSTYIGIGVTVAAIVVACLIAAVIAWRLASAIGDPVKAVAERLKRLSEGDLKSPVPSFDTRDETKILLDATHDLCKDLSMVIEDMDYMLDHMADGDFTISSRCSDAYVGDFRSLLESESSLKEQLIDILLKIDVASDQVASAADQVASAAQALAQGCTQQASSVEELAASISEMSDNISQSAGHAKTAEEENQRSHSQIEMSSGKMNDLADAIHVIHQKSGEIDKVIKTIEDIAFQTNILALNAAVEAARAGAAGKGFAVVADEVRNLASKSQEAAESTTVLIQETVKAVERGNDLSGETVEALGEVVKSAEAVLKAVTLISSATAEQAGTAAQVSVGIDQISSVVQTNSATSEQSAAASEQLSGQARMLKEMVSRFKLPKEHGPVSLAQH